MNKKLIRRLRRGEDGFTILSQTTQKGIVQLCDACGRQDSCQFARSVEDAKKHKVNMATLSCESYSPPLIFRDDTGLQKVGDKCNTFRTGKTWHQRLKPGDHVSLYDNKGNRFGSALVQSVHCGDQTEMLDQHSCNNHMLVDTDLSNAEASTKLAGIIKKFYGHFMSRDTPLTVIYLERI